MKKTSNAIAVVLIACAALGLLPPKANGFSLTISMDPNGNSTSAAAPLGVVESLGTPVVGERAAHGRTPFWDGEIVRAPLDSKVDVTVDQAGRVDLTRGSAARFALRSGPTLVISVISGELVVTLNRGVSSYLEISGFNLVSSTGASFRVGLGNSGPALEVIRGDAWFEQQPTAQRRYVVRPVGLGSNISVRARSTRQIQVQVTDENDRKVPDLPILFALSGKGFGSLGGGVVPRSTMTITTDARGVATVNFQAGDSAGNETISATVEGTRYSWIGQITVAAAGGGFWTVRNSLIITGIAAGAGVGLYFGLRNNSEPIRAAPPPKVTP